MLKFLITECRRTFKPSNLNARLSNERKLCVSCHLPLPVPVKHFTRKAETIVTKYIFHKHINGRRPYVTKDNGSNSSKSDAKCKKARESSSSSERCIDRPLPWPSGHREKFMFHKDIEDIMNEQINVEFKAFYYYLSMETIMCVIPNQLPNSSPLTKAAYFGRVDVALPGCQSFFTQMHHEEHEHALRFVQYVIMRGGKVHLCPIQPPDSEDWECPLHAFKTALLLEKEVSEKLVATNTMADKHGDINASDFIVTGFMEDQMKSVNEMARLVTIVSGVGDHALARFIFDKDLLENYVTSEFNILKTKNKPKPQKHNDKSDS